MATQTTETQKYQVIKTEENFEIRYYPSATVAMITSFEKSYGKLSRDGFRKLTGYIFEGNDKKLKIAMTTPVHMDINESISCMSFVMPATYTKENLPAPNDASIFIMPTAAEYVGTVRFGGFATDYRIKNYAQQLENYLKVNAIYYNGSFRFLGYNPPYQIFGRRNEVIVNVSWKGSSPK